MILLNSGYLKLVGARVVLVQRIGRHVMIDFAREVDFDRTMPLDEIRKLYAELRYRNDPPKVGMLNIGNLKFVLYKLLYRLRDNAFFSKVYRHRLDRPLFSVRNDRELIFSYEDFDHARLATDEAALKLNDNFNRLAGKLKKIGVSLVFMPVPDKYDLYSESLVDNPYPPNPLFDKLRAQKMDYRWIDSKSILTEELRKGEKDLFYADDTHWSEKAARKIFEKVSLL